MMANNLRKLLAIMLATTMCAGTMSLPVFAEDGTVVEEETITNKDSTVTEQTTTTTTTTDPETGKVTVTVTIDKKTDGTTDDGVKVEGEETRTDTTVKDADGNEIQKSWHEKGYEKREWEEEVPVDAELPEVEVELKPGETTTGSASSEPEEEVVGDVQRNEYDQSYNYTEKTSTIERKAEATTSATNTTVEQSDTDLTSITPVDYEGKTGVRYGSTKNGNEMVKGYYWDYNYDDVEQPDEPGYDFQYTGVDEIALDKYRTNVWEVTYKTDEDGNLLRDEDGNLIIESKIAVSPSGAHSKGWDKLGYPTQTKIMVLTQYGENGEKERYFAYCIDKDTSTTDGSWYSIANLEDSDYYPDEESAAHLRAIVTNGYWGTEEGTGSITQIREKLLAAYDEDDVITVVDKNGDEQTYKVHDIIGDLCEGEALNVTQAAIWSYSNGSLNVQTGENNIIVNDNFSYALSKEPDAEAGAKSLARMRIMYNWLLSLTQEKSENDTTVINEKNFIEDLTLVVGNKVQDAESNYDSDTENDVYNTSLNFSLAFVPNLEKDELLVEITYTDYDGVERQIIKRLAGDNEENLGYDVITPDEDGYYTISGLKLSENEDFDFDLKIQGTQYLEQGVYIYTPYGGRDASQTLVGMAEGTRDVSVTTSVTVSFSVDDKKNVVGEHYWESKGDPAITPDEPEDPSDPEEPEEPEEPGDESETPVIVVTITETPVEATETPDAVEVSEETEEPETEEIPDEEPPLVEISDEELPLANVPQTGDISFIWYAVSLLSGIGLAGLNIFGKKGKKEQND